MKSRLERELHELFISDGISSKSNIADFLICRMVSIIISQKNNNKNNIPESSEEIKGNYGFQFSSRSYEKDSEDEKIKFRLPRVTIEQLKAYLDFFHISHEDYISESLLTLDDKFVFDELMPRLKSCYESLKKDHSAIIIKYKLLSKPLLESSAIKTLEEYAEKILDIILPHDAQAIPENMVDLIETMYLLKSTVRGIEWKPALYKLIIAMDQKINNFLQSPDISKNKDLKKYLQLILEGLDLFARYHRTESVIANIIFMNEIDKFLNENYKISISQCDVVEETLLRLAGAQLGKSGKCHVNPGGDKSRLVFQFIDISKENAEKVVKYCQNLGDETAMEGNGYRSYASSIPESSNIELQSAVIEHPQRGYVGSTQREKIERHAVEVDGKFVYEKLFPELQAEIHRIAANEPKILEKYRDESKEYINSLERKAAAELTLSGSKAGLFQPTTDADIISIDNESRQVSSLTT